MARSTVRFGRLTIPVVGALVGAGMLAGLSVPDPADAATTVRAAVPTAATVGVTSPATGTSSTRQSTRMRSGDLPGWRQVFAEDFGRPAPLGDFLARYSNVGAYPYPWTDTSRSVRRNPGYYDPNRTVSVANGVLDAHLHYDRNLGRHLVTALVPDLPRMTYGRFSMRLRADAIDGYKIAPMLWPDSDSWPEGGEFDFPEGALSGGSLSAFSHFARRGGGQRHFSTNVSHRQWHTYETIWSKGKVVFRVDGKRIGRTTKFVPNRAMHWVLQFETDISTQAPSKSAHGHVQVDWLKAYRRS